MKTREDTRVAIAAVPCAPATNLWFDDRVLASCVWMDAADECPADRTEVPGRQAIRNMRSETTPDQVIDPNFGFKIEPDGGRFLCVKY